LAYVELASKRRDPEYLDKAWPLLREAAAAQPSDPALYYTIANLLSAAGQKRQAIEYYRRSLEQDPLQPDALLKLAALLEPAPEARELREKALRILPHAQ
jgi:tetratricopeptide (TPR) repeat protein